MSHFTYIKTRFQNLSYLEKALNKLNLTYKKSQNLLTSAEPFQMDLVISQSTGYDIIFTWNGQEYELATDLSFWAQPHPVETFMNKVAQQYACELVVGESQKIGFQPISDQKNLDGSRILVLDRFNLNKI